MDNAGGARGGAARKDIIAGDIGSAGGIGENIGNAGGAPGGQTGGQTGNSRGDPHGVATTIQPTGSPDGQTGGGHDSATASESGSAYDSAPASQSGNAHGGAPGGQREGEPRSLRDGQIGDASAEPHGGALSQRSAPLYEALLRFKANRVVKFDVPGHKGGRWNKDLTDFLGKSCLEMDVNSMRPLDNLSHPVSVIRDAERLAAEAFGAKDAFFMVNGTTAAVQAMIMSACKSGDRIIMPRNVHRSAINALVICGAVPVYVNPGVNSELGISLGMSARDVAAAMDAHPDAKAVLVNNPTYYGVCSDLRAIVGLAHSRGMLALVDEAHGAHFYFAGRPGAAAAGSVAPGAAGQAGAGASAGAVASGAAAAGATASGAHAAGSADPNPLRLPLPAMTAGADMAAVSMHKTGGSLTQSSFLLCGESARSAYVRQIVNLSQTTSASYLLMASLDIARRNLSLSGGAYVAQALRLAEYARAEINKLGGYRAFSRELANGGDVFDFDATKLSVHTRDIGLAGIEVYDKLRDEYGIQIEFGDIGNFLAIISAGDRELEIERLVSALSEIKRLHARDKAGMFDHEYIPPTVEMPPQQAFYSERSSVPIAAGAGRVSAEFVMCYPPGIPILAPGERLTGEIIQYIQYAKAKGCFLTGTQDMELNNIQVIA